MNSFDVWDTLIGRWYLGPDSVFSEIENSYGKNFTWYRKHAESIAVDKSLLGVYKVVGELLNISEHEYTELMEMEISLEEKRTFPIYANASKIKEEDLIVSDFYMEPTDLGRILKSNGIKTSNLFVSYDGKRTGKMWERLLPNHSIETHFGDNLEGDVIVPKRFGIATFQYTEHALAPDELEIFGLGYPRVALLMRAVRLSNQSHPIISEQVNINIPLLIGVAHYLKRYHTGRFLFTARDCFGLKLIFDTLFPNQDSHILYTSREAYNNNTESFSEYVLDNLQNHPLIVDLQGSGETCYNFFRKHNIEPLYFAVVDSGLSDLYHVNSIVRRVNGFSDKIEKINYANVGRTFDYKDGSPVQFPFENNQFVELQENTVASAAAFLKKGFDVGVIGTPEKLVRYALRKLEQRCVAEEFIKHEA